MHSIPMPVGDCFAKGISISLKLLQEAKKLNMPRLNLMSWEAIKDNIIKYKEIKFGADSPTCIKCIDEIKE